MYLEGCKWEYVQHQLDESDPKKLFTDIPLILLVPEVDKITPTTVRFYLILYFFIREFTIAQSTRFCQEQVPYPQLVIQLTSL
jgi:hypothetical protein